ncbi:MAG: DUF5719 family protein, partial [Actinomycetia bacterium]|nr:DUF5719 family protein [Actinomycetes bacterium]
AGDDTAADEDAAAATAADPATGERSVSGPTPDISPYLALGVGAAAPGLMATQHTWAAAEEVGGLAATPCQPGREQTWLIGGGAGPERAERLLISNPGANPITVDVTVYSTAGVSSPPAGQGLSVPPQGRVVLLGDALAPGADAPAFHIAASGGDALVVLAETELDGTLPVGFDLVSAAAPPSLSVVVPGVAAPEVDQGTLLLRVVNPGEIDAIGTVSALTADGERPIPEAVVRVPAQSAVDVEIEGLDPGVTSLLVTADSEISAAARTVRVSGAGVGGVDAGWAVGRSAPDELAGAALLPVDGVSQTLVLSAATTEATVAVTTVSGTEVERRDVVVPAAGSVTQVLDADAVWVRPAAGGEVVGAVVVASGEDGPAGHTVIPLREPQTIARLSQVVPVG